jgi:hypothetical protein
MDKVEKDEEREHRITMEAIVDCYGPQERLSGWYCYLDDRLAFPFKARCTKEHLVSPLREGDEVEAIGMADIDDCGNECSSWWSGWTARWAYRCRRWLP